MRQPEDGHQRLVRVVREHVGQAGGGQVRGAVAEQLTAAQPSATAAGAWRPRRRGAAAVIAAAVA